MKTYSATASIKATPERIWNLLTDAPGYPAWNPAVTKIDGAIAAGQKIAVHATISPGRAFPVKVSEFVPNQRMVWSGGMPLGIFKGVRTFTLAPKAEGTVEFTMREVFDGLLSPLMLRVMPDLQPHFDEFAAALKKQAESR